MLVQSSIVFLSETNTNSGLSVCFIDSAPSYADHGDRMQPACGPRACVLPLYCSHFRSGRDTRSQISIEVDAWSFQFCHRDRPSAIRISDAATVRDRDEHRLLASATTLKGLGAMIRGVEQRYRVYFQRNHAAIRSDIP